MGIDPDVAVAALASVEDVAGRYRRATLGDTRVRLLMAKNPAGWQEAIDMLAEPPRPVVAAINARIADGRDPSWLWDVPFEALAGRRVVAIGERRHDLAVRLHYAEVDHEVADDLPRALALLGSAEVDYIGNYTAFQDELDRVGRAGGPGRDGAAR
jgi:UDP-N-acetylmuramyl tripeptide synthase